MSYKIKIPVFITAPLAEPVNNYESMIKQLQSRIDRNGNINIEEKIFI